MTITLRIWLYLIAAWTITMLAWPCCGQPVLSLPSYTSSVHFADSSLPVLINGRLVAMSSVWQSDMMGLVCSNYMQCAEPEMNTVILGEGYPGTNWAIVTGYYSDGSVTVAAYSFTAKGFKVYTTDGATSLSYRVKAHLSDFEWTSLTNANPLWGYFSAPQQFFWLTTNTVAQFYQDSLPVEQSADTNQTETVQSKPPMPL
jgi:hypothetical protein